jgi:hypothetical protein
MVMPKAAMRQPLIIILAILLPTCSNKQKSNHTDFTQQIMQTETTNIFLENKNVGFQQPGQKNFIGQTGA